MADLNIPVADNVRLVRSNEARLTPVRADEAITRGQPLYRKANGRAAVARGNAVATAKVEGLATSDASTGEVIEALWQGGLTGYDLSAINPGTTIYLSTLAGGKLADTAPTGTGNVVMAVGTVVCDTSPSQNRYLLIDVPQNAAPVALA